MKYRVSYEERVFYQETEVEASSEEEAKDKFLEELEQGNVLAVNSEIARLNVTSVRAEKEVKV